MPHAVFNSSFEWRRRTLVVTSLLERPSPTPDFLMSGLVPAIPRSANGAQHE
jgi:hypothetical protein